MKKLIALSIVFITLFSLLAGCTGFEISEEEQQYIGTWVSRPSDGTILTVTFLDDKTAQVKLNVYESPGLIKEELISVTGYWNLYDEKLTVNYGDNLTTYSIPFTIVANTLQTKWRGSFILYRQD